MEKLLNPRLLLTQPFVHPARKNSVRLGQFPSRVPKAQPARSPVASLAGPIRAPLSYPIPVSADPPTRLAASGPGCLITALPVARQQFFPPPLLTIPYNGTRTILLLHCSPTFTSGQLPTLRAFLSSTSFFPKPPNISLFTWTARSFDGFGAVK